MQNGPFQFDHSKLLNSNELVTVTVTANAGVVVDMLMAVRNKDHHPLLNVNNGKPITSGSTGAAFAKIDVAKLPGARYIIWSIWAQYPVPAELVFDVKVVVKQGTTIFETVIRGKMPAEKNIVAVANDGLYIGAPL